MILGVVALDVYYTCDKCVGLRQEPTRSLQLLHYPIIIQDVSNTGTDVVAKDEHLQAASLACLQLLLVSPGCAIKKWFSAAFRV